MCDPARLWYVSAKIADMVRAYCRNATFTCCRYGVIIQSLPVLTAVLVL